MMATCTRKKEGTTGPEASQHNHEHHRSNYLGACCERTYGRRCCLYCDACILKAVQQTHKSR
jgi:hypothetical protein